MASSDSTEPADEAEGTRTLLGEKTEAMTESASIWNAKLSEWLETLPWLPEFLVDPVATVLLLIGLLASAWILYVAFRPLILRWVHRAVEKTPFNWDNKLFGYGVFRWLTHLLPGILILLFSPGLFQSAPMLEALLTTGAKVYLLVSLFFVIDSLINAVQAILRKTKLGAHLDLTSIAQVLKLVAALIIFLLCFAAILQKPPLALLRGIGVLASVLMLVFKDVILGFVAGIQLATNRMLSVGDWLEMPSRNADGDVEEIGLTTVKVRNWDKTVTTIPTYALISDSFKNWRGMSESGGRRIKRSLQIDTNSIRLATP
ncbi:MAG: mechanosensitive ion channel domain-containing protein, partial [Verrucomicrobiota bacterium]